VVPACRRHHPQIRPIIRQTLFRDVGENVPSPIALRTNVSLQCSIEAAGAFPGSTTAADGWSMAKYLSLQRCTSYAVEPFERRPSLLLKPMLATTRFIYMVLFKDKPMALDRLYEASAENRGDCRRMS